jgi:hypothetical protein
MEESRVFKTIITNPIIASDLKKGSMPQYPKENKVKLDDFYGEHT